jgi:hypothetical protein
MNTACVRICPPAICHKVVALRPKVAACVAPRPPSYNPAMSVTDRTPVGGSPRGRVFQRVIGRELPVAVRAEGCTIWDADGRAYLDAAGGAVVVNVGHGRQSVANAMERQARAFTYVHGTTFTSEPLEAYARAVGRYLPVEDPAIYPVSGGSEAIESCLSWYGPTTWRAASPTGPSSLPGGGATTATPWARWTSPGASRYGGRTSPGWGASTTSAPRIHIAVERPPRMPSPTSASSSRSWRRRSPRPGRAEWRRSWPSPSWARPSAR